MKVFESNFTEQELSPLINIIKKGEIGFGSNVKILEQKFEEFSKCTYNIATNSASASAFMIFSYLKEKYGECDVYTPSIAFASPAWSAKHFGHNLIFIDVNDELLFDCEDYRNKRAKPRLDDKTLTSWNGLMLKGYVDAYTALGNKEYLEAALKNAQFILDTQLKKDGSLYHNYKDGKSTINGYLEDYAAVISGFLSLYEVTTDTKWLTTAKDLADYSFAKFHNEETAMFYFTSSEDPGLVSRSVEYRDNVIASSNSIMANNLFVLAHHFDEENFRNTAKQMLKNVLPEIEKYPSGFSNWLGLLENYRNPYYEVAIVGDDAMEKTLKFKTNYLPNTLIASSTKNDSLPLLANRYMDGETMIFVCQNYTCKLPVAEIDEAKKLIE